MASPWSLRHDVGGGGSAGGRARARPPRPVAYLPQRRLAREAPGKRAAGWRGRRRARTPGPGRDGDRGQGRRRAAHRAWGGGSPWTRRGADTRDQGSVRPGHARHARPEAGLPRTCRTGPRTTCGSPAPSPSPTQPTTRIQRRSTDRARSSSTTTTWRMRARGFGEILDWWSASGDASTDGGPLTAIGMNALDALLARPIDIPSPLAAGIAVDEEQIRLSDSSSPRSTCLPPSAVRWSWASRDPGRRCSPPRRHDASRRRDTTCSSPASTGRWPSTWPPPSVARRA